MSEGAYVWLIPDGYIPEGGTGRQPSHEAICVLNPSGEEAHLSITFYFEDRDPTYSAQVTVEPYTTYSPEQLFACKGPGE